MRVLYWSELFWPYIGGAEVFGSRLLGALQERGYEFTVVTSHDYLDLPDKALYRRIPIHRFPFRKVVAGAGIDLLLEVRQQVMKIKQAFAPDLVHINGITPSVLFHLQTLQAHQAPTLLRMNQEVLCQDAKAQDTLTARALREADWVACVSSAVLAQIRRWMPETIPHSSVVYTGLDLPSEALESLPVHSPRLLCLGRLVPQKGFDLVLAALASIKGQFPHLRLVVAGDGSGRHDLERQVDALGLGHMVDFLGWVEPDQIPALLNSATLVMMPSRHEGLPLVAIQAAQMARPIVATRVSGLEDVVIHGETGLLVEKEDSTALAEAITFLLDHPETAIQMGQAARRRAVDVFGWQRAVDEYDALHRKLVQGNADVKAV
jgi:glycogen(starch) synthase